MQIITNCYQHDNSRKHCDGQRMPNNPLKELHDIEQNFDEIIKEPSGRRAGKAPKLCRQSCGKIFIIETRTTRTYARVMEHMEVQRPVPFTRHLLVLANHNTLAGDGRRNERGSVQEKETDPSQQKKQQGTEESP